MTKVHVADEAEVSERPLAAIGSRPCNRALWSAMESSIALYYFFEDAPLPLLQLPPFLSLLAISTRCHSHATFPPFHHVSPIAEAASTFSSTLLQLGNPYFSCCPAYAPKMGRGKGTSVRKDSVAHEFGMVGRRPYMEHIHPAPSTKRSADRPPRPNKRPRTITPSAANPSPPTANLLYAPNRYIDIEKLLGPASSRDVCIHISADYLTTSNPGIRNRHLWGTDVYTDDSDIVAILAHTGYYCVAPSKPTFDFLSVLLELRRHRSRVSSEFLSSERNAIRSRPWGNVYSGARLRIKDASILSDDAHLKPKHSNRRPAPVPLPGIVKWPAKAKTKKTPFLESVVCFDMTNLPCLTYDVKEVLGVGSDEARAPLTRFKKEVLFLEDGAVRYEVCSVGDGKKGDRIRIARVKPDAILRHLMAAAGVLEPVTCPLRETDLVVLHELPWHKLYWDMSGLTIANKHYMLNKMAWRSKRE